MAEKNWAWHLNQLVLSVAYYVERSSTGLVTNDKPRLLLPRLFLSAVCESIYSSAVSHSAYVPTSADCSNAQIIHVAWRTSSHGDPSHGMGGIFCPLRQHFLTG